MDARQSVERVEPAVAFPHGLTQTAILSTSSAIGNVGAPSSAVIAQPVEMAQQLNGRPRVSYGYLPYRSRTDNVTQPLFNSEILNALAEKVARITENKKASESLSVRKASTNTRALQGLIPSPAYALSSKSSPIN